MGADFISHGEDQRLGHAPGLLPRLIYGSKEDLIIRAALRSRNPGCPGCLLSRLHRQYKAIVELQNTQMVREPVAYGAQRAAQTAHLQLVAKPIVECQPIP